MRGLVLHQRILSGPSPSLKAKIYESLENLESFLCSKDKSSSSSLVSVFYLEKALVYLYYRHTPDTETQAALQSAEASYGFSWEFSGRLGRRTKFQTFDVTQLVVTTKSSRGEHPRKMDSSILPNSCALEDSVLLERIQFTDSSHVGSQSHVETSSLDPIEQCFLLAEG
jgi:hypothetical protein